MTQDEPQYKAILEKCGGLEYNGFVHVDTHFYAIASPKDEAVDAGCPFVVAFAKFDKDKIAHKRISLWQVKENGEDMFDEDGSLHIGSFKLDALAQAYEDSDPSAAGRYDVVTNSCADFVISLGSKLGVKIDSRITSFVARRLVQVAGQELFDSVRKSLGYVSLLSNLDRHLRGDDAVTNAQLVDLLVETHATRFLFAK
jgi:hypothetical protein